MPLQQRPHPDAVTRHELAEVLGISYQRAYYWTGRGGSRGGSKRSRPIVRPTWPGSRGGAPDWFSPEDVQQLRQLIEVLDRAERAKRRGS